MRRWARPRFRSSWAPEGTAERPALPLAEQMRPRGRPRRSMSGRACTSLPVSNGSDARFLARLSPGGAALCRLRLGALATLRAVALDVALQVLEGVVDVAPDHRRGQLIGDPAEEAAGRVVAQAEHHAGAVRAVLAEPPAPTLVDAHHARPGHVARLFELDDLDQATHLGRADAHQHPVAGATAALLAAVHLPARDAAEEERVVVGVRHVVPDERAWSVDDEFPFDAHQPMKGKRRSAASSSSLPCISPRTWRLI